MLSVIDFGYNDNNLLKSIIKIVSIKMPAVNDQDKFVNREISQELESEASKVSFVAFF